MDTLLEVLIVDEILADLKRKGAWGTSTSAESINRQNEIRGSWLVKVRQQLEADKERREASDERRQAADALLKLSEQVTDLTSALETKEAELQAARSGTGVPGVTGVTYKVDLGNKRLEDLAERIASATERIADHLGGQ